MSEWRPYVMLLADNRNNENFGEEVAKHLRKHPVGIVYLDIKRFGELEKQYGPLVCDRILQALKQLLLHYQTQRSTWIITSRMIGDDCFLAVQLEENSSSLLAVRRLREQADSFSKELAQRVNELVSLNQGKIELYSGISVLRFNPQRSFEDLLYGAVKEASQDAKNQEDLEFSVKRSEFNQIVQQELLSTYFQPIVSLHTGEIYGYESLSRGPMNSFFTSPLNLFSFAEKTNQLYLLEKMARERAISNFAPADRNLKLFINISSHVIHDPQFTPGQTLKLLEYMNLSPENVIFEITERNHIEDFSTVRKALEHYRRQGYRIAVDDAGAGYSSLQAIAELRPDYIKIDRSLVQNIERDKVKETILETIITFADKLRAGVIAEGIETREELSKVVQLGAQYGQGFFLGKPAPELNPVSTEASSLILHARKPSPEKIEYGIVLKTIMRSTKTFDERTTVSEVVEFFKQFETEHGVVIVREERPVGLVMREALFRNLASQYGVPLYWKRSIRKLMDAHPLTLELGTPIETASRLAMARDHTRIYDYVVVTQEGNLEGIVTIQSMLDIMTSTQIETALDSNPLTGLPGNRRIEQELFRRIESKQSFSVIYADLDSFKKYNDRFGFQKGDSVIRFLAEILRETAVNLESRGSFLGHIGGDDFILITKEITASQMCADIISKFHERMEQLCSEGTIQNNDISISLAVLDCRVEDEVELSLGSIAERAGEIKHIAKQRTGSSCVHGNFTTIYGI